MDGAASSVDWVAFVEQLNAEQGWGFAPADVLAYVAALRSLLPPTASPAKLRRVCLNYYADAPLVAALSDCQHPNYHAAWVDWHGFAFQVLYSSGWFASDDPACDTEDLAQMTLLELLRSLPSFNFESRLHTWAHAVIVRSAQRAGRDRCTARRVQQRFVMRQQNATSQFAPEYQQPTASTEGRVLSQLVHDVLMKTADLRLPQIFLLHALRDLTSDQIAALLQLKPARVRRLLGQARGIVRHSPALQAWCAD
ncbi:sigma-70 family RNA polymerase sigma factor [Candidatus Viridilinea mediisalina]|nr:sigma-70 family RNA polymerase sigma factor [Candidatus Viridilinea mediisalina]